VALLLSEEIPAEDERQDSDDEERLMKRLTT
jgi:hypothetical protein